jgi:hypothetical protein
MKTNTLSAKKMWNDYFIYVVAGILFIPIFILGTFLYPFYELGKYITNKK